MINDDSSLLFWATLYIMSVDTRYLLYASANGSHWTQYPYRLLKEYSRF